MKSSFARLFLETPHPSFLLACRKLRTSHSETRQISTCWFINRLLHFEGRIHADPTFSFSASEMQQGALNLKPNTIKETLTMKAFFISNYSDRNRLNRLPKARIRVLASRKLAGSGTVDDTTRSGSICRSSRSPDIPQG